MPGRSRHTSGAFTAVLLSALASVPTHAVADEAISFSHAPISPYASTLRASWVNDGAELGTTAIASLRPRTAPFLRLESSWVRGLGDTPASVRLGDTTSDPGAWGSAVRFAGVQVGTAANRRADVIYDPRLALAGVAILPTTVESMFGAARTAGALFSKPQSLITRPTFAAAGCRSYSLSLGRAREDYGLAGNRYGPTFANSTVTCGTQTGLAVEAHGEYLQGEARIAGLNVSQRIGATSAMSVGAATSGNTAGTGWSLGMGLNRSADRFQFDLRGRLQSAAYRELGAQEDSDAVSQRILASVAAKLGVRNSVGLAYATQRTYSLQRTDVVALTHTLGFGSNGSMSVVANCAMNEDRNAGIRLSFARRFDF
jgi:outer membrane usher protein